MFLGKFEADLIGLGSALLCREDVDGCPGVVPTLDAVVGNKARNGLDQGEKFFIDEPRDCFRVGDYVMSNRDVHSDKLKQETFGTATSSQKSSVHWRVVFRN